MKSNVLLDIKKQLREDPVLFVEIALTTITLARGMISSNLYILSNEERIKIGKYLDIIITKVYKRNLSVEEVLELNDVIKTKSFVNLLNKI